MQKRFFNPATAFMLIVAVIAWLFVGLQLYILLHNVPENGLTYWQAIGRFLLFFTILTNLLVAISLTFIVIFPLSPLGRFFAKPNTLTAIALYIFIVGLVYNLVLRNTWQPLGLQKWVDEGLHVVVPLLYLLLWFMFVPKGKLKWGRAIAWLIYPALYLGYALLRGSLEGFYPYPFLDIHQIGYTKVGLNSLGLLIVFLVAGFGFIGINNLKSVMLKPA